LCVAWFIGADQSEVRETEEKQESAESGEQKTAGGRAGNFQLFPQKELLYGGIRPKLRHDSCHCD
jgi:hypothetical protein